MATGSATLDFGTAGLQNVEASVAVTGQAGILATSLVEAWVRVAPAGTSDHSMDEHRVERLKIDAGNIVAGTGFTIYGECTLGATYGAFTIDWVWV